MNHPTLSVLERIAVALERIADAQAPRETLFQSKVEKLAKELGYTPKYMAGVLQGQRHGASPILIRKLARMGINTTVDGEKL